MLKFLNFFSDCSGANLPEVSGKDDVKKVFQELMDLIDETLTEAQDTLNKALDAVKSKAAELEDEANAELDKLLAPLRKQLDDLIAGAKAGGFDLKKIRSYVDDFSNIPATAVHNLIDCMSQEITKAQDLVNDAINNAKKIAQDLNTIAEEIDKCSEGSSGKEALAFAKLLKKIAKETAKAPKKIMADVTKTVALIKELIPTLETCFRNEVKKAGEDAKKNVAECALCVKKGLIS